MAKIVDIRTIDDVDGGPADETVEYAIDGVEYEIDLSAENAARLRTTLQPWIDQSRRAASRRGGRRPRMIAPRSSGSVRQVDPVAVRAWARTQGMNVSERGRLPASVVEDYIAAHNPGPDDSE